MTAVSTTTEKITDFLITWTPRAIAAAVGGYYGLGIAHELGLMAMIDQIAIQVIKHFFSYAGIGALMPTVQWYSAWAVRIVIGLATGFLYDLAEKCAKYCYFRITNQPEQSVSG